MLYQISKASKYYGADTVFEDINFEIKGNEKIALVGRNGCGKTTFLRCMCGEENFDKGTINMQNGTRIGYLAQKVLDCRTRVNDNLRAFIRFTKENECFRRTNGNRLF